MPLLWPSPPLSVAHTTYPHTVDRALFFFSYSPPPPPSARPRVYTRFVPPFSLLSPTPYLSSIHDPHCPTFHSLFTQSWFATFEIQQTVGTIGWALLHSLLQVVAQGVIACFVNVLCDSTMMGGGGGGGGKSEGRQGWRRRTAAATPLPCTRLQSTRGRAGRLAPFPRRHSP